MRWCQEVLLRLAVVFLTDGIHVIWIIGHWIVEFHDTFSCALEIAGNDIEMMNFVRSQKHSEPYVPIW